MPDSQLIDDIQKFVAKYDSSTDAKASEEFATDIRPITQAVRNSAQKHFSGRPDPTQEKVNAEVSQMDSNEPNREVISQLVEATSMQAKVANKAWFGMVTVALFAVLPRNLTDSGNILLPFGLGEVTPIWFHSVIYIVFVVLIFAFASAHSQQVRTHKLAHWVIDSLGQTQGVISPRELFDMSRVPSLNRVAPIAQSLRGKYQFFATSKDCPKWRRRLTVAYYVLLKIVALAVYFVLPGCALWISSVDFVAPQGFRIAFAFSGVLAGLVLLQVLVLEVIYAIRVTYHLLRD